MFYKTRFLLSLLVFCTALTACSDNNNEESPAATTTAPEVTNTEAVEQQAVKTEATPSIDKVEVGMSEQAVTDLLGPPTLVQTRTIDALTATHSEWTNDAGTTSVQFQNGKVKFIQFTPTDK